MFGSDFLLKKAWKSQDSYWTCFKKCSPWTNSTAPNNSGAEPVATQKTPAISKKNLEVSGIHWHLGHQDVWPLKRPSDLTPIHSERFASFQQQLYRNKKTNTFIFIFNFFVWINFLEIPNNKKKHNSIINLTDLQLLHRKISVVHLPPVVERQWSQPSLECYRSGTWGNETGTRIRWETAFGLVGNPIRWHQAVKVTLTVTHPANHQIINFQGVCCFFFGKHDKLVGGYNQPIYEKYAQVKLGSSFPQGSGVKIPKIFETTT